METPRRSPGRGHGGNPRNTKTHRPPAIKWLGPLACQEIQRQAGVGAFPRRMVAGPVRPRAEAGHSPGAPRRPRVCPARDLGRRAGARRRDRPREPQGRAFRELRHGGPEGRSVPSDGHLREQGAREARRDQAPLLRRRQVRSRWAHSIDRVERLPIQSPAIEAPARYPPARAIRLRGRRWAYDARDEGARRRGRPRLRAPQDVPLPRLLGRGASMARRARVHALAELDARGVQAPLCDMEIARQSASLRSNKREKRQRDQPTA